MESLLIEFFVPGSIQDPFLSLLLQSSSPSFHITHFSHSFNNPKEEGSFELKVFIIFMSWGMISFFCCCCCYCCFVLVPFIPYSFFRVTKVFYQSLWNNGMVFENNDGNCKRFYLNTFEIFKIFFIFSLS